MRDGTRRHPIGAILSDAACGALPREDALDRLALLQVHRRRIADEARIIAALRLEGENQQARRRAEEAAEAVIAALPEDQRDPDYLTPRDDGPDDPEGLANLVQRW